MPLKPRFSEPVYMEGVPHRALCGDRFRNLLQLIGQEQQFWGFDSEFLMSGRVNAPEDVHTVQFSNGVDTVVLESADALKTWLHNHHRVKILYGFVVLPDLASVEEWLPQGNVSYYTRGSQMRGRVKYRGFNAVVCDCRSLLLGFGIRKLADAGDVLGFPKLAKPSWLGLRKWSGETEHKQFIEYAAADAIITSRIVKWLHDGFNADPLIHASAGTLARDVFVLPKRLQRVDTFMLMSPLECKVRACCFAGRSEGFRTGYMRGVTYNDVASLYPCSMSVTRVLEITGAKRCSPENLAVCADTPLDTRAFGWLEGTFETVNDLWGLPLRGRNNFYATGRITGFFHTFDLVAAKARPLFISRAYRPIFEPSPLHDKFVRLTLDRIEGRLQGNAKMYAKAVLNACSGKLGQSHPVAETSNFFAYSTLLAHSHAVMSRFFDRCKSEVLAMDTDSVFSYDDMSGQRFDLSDGEQSIPFIMDAKGKGDLAFFRSKNYILKTEHEPVFARHGWVYFWEDYLKLFDGTVTELVTRQEIKHTLMTRTKEALKMAKGRWRTKPIVLTLEKIKALLKADMKRSRSNSDSYGLLMKKQSSSSTAWNYDQMILEPNNILNLS